MPTFAAIDIGSNSCRLKIAKVVAHHLKTVHEDREVTRLGASVFEVGLISPEAMEATLQALKRFQRAVQSHGALQIRVVATSAMRDARNAAVFQARVKEETGWTMEIISGLEEGRLIHLGVVGVDGAGPAAEPKPAGRVLLIDLGVSPTKVVHRASLPADTFTRGPVTLSPHQYYAFWTALQEESDDPNLPISIARALRVEVFQPPIFAALCSPTLDVAAERISTTNGLSARCGSRSTGPRAGSGSHPGGLRERLRPTSSSSGSWCSG